jgi:tetratricopeptide (TPR) repeat protein
VLRELRQRDEAIAEYRKAIEIDPKDANAHYALGLVLGDLGQRAKAIAEYKAAIALDPHLVAPISLRK